MSGMYGTTMIAPLADGVTPDELRTSVQEWEKERQVPGYRSNHMLVTDDGKTIVQAVVFDSKEHYMALADDPAQDEWYRTKVAPKLAGEPRWIDGTWI